MSCGGGAGRVTSRSAKEGAMWLKRKLRRGTVRRGQGREKEGLNVRDAAAVQEGQGELPPEVPKCVNEPGKVGPRMWYRL